VPGSAVIRGAKQRPVSHKKIREVAEKYHIIGFEAEDLKTRLNTLCALHDYIVASDNMRFAVSRNTTLVYADSLDEIAALQQFDKNCTITEAVVTHGPGTIYRKNSKFNYRISLRHTKCSDEMRNNIAKFISLYKDDAKPCGSLHKWALGKIWWAYTESHFFIDVKDEKMKTVLDIMAPGMTSSMYTIHSDK